VDGIIALDGTACDYLTALNLYLWYYDHRSTPRLECIQVYQIVRSQELHFVTNNLQGK
jgi:hypothetical protein